MSNTEGSLRVVLVGSWPPLPGISAYVHSLAQSLAGRNDSKGRPTVQLSVLTFRRMYPSFLYPGGAPPKDETFPPDPPNVAVDRRLNWYNPLGWFWAGLTLQADLLHVQFWSVPIAPALWVLLVLCRWRGIPTVLTVHNLAGHESSGLFAWVSRRLFAQARLVIVHVPQPPARFVDEIRRATGRDPVYIPHGSLALFSREEYQALSAPPLLPAGAQGILFFGAIRPYKGLDVLLEAFGEIASRYPNAWLIVAGRPWEPWDRYDRLLKARSWKDRVLLRLEYIPTSDVHRYFEASSVVVAPYRSFDAQSGVGLAAIAFEKPLLVTDVGGLASLQPLAEYVLPPGDSRRLAEALDRVLRSPEEQERMKIAQRAVAADTSWDRVADETFDMYESVILSNWQEIGKEPA